MISSCPPYYSSAAFCLLRSHHFLLFRLVASDCLSCSAALRHSVLSSLALSFSMPLSSCLRLLLSCYSACTLSALLCHEATSIGYWEARLRLSHQGTQTKFCVLVCVRGRGEKKIFFFAQCANTRKQALSRRSLPCDALAPTVQNRTGTQCPDDTSAEDQKLYNRTSLTSWAHRGSLSKRRELVLSSFPPPPSPSFHQFSAPSL